MNPSMTAPSPGRIASVDAYRGWVMLLMLGEVLSLGRVAELHPDSSFWAFLGHHQSHVAWVGCALHDLIQPSFSFLVGVALPLSIASRLAKGQSLARMLGHAAWRSVVLIALGIFLRSMRSEQTNFTFEDTLTQIGLGYFVLFGLGLGTSRVRWVALAVILVGYWLAFALYPLPGPDFDWGRAGVSSDWEHHLSGFAAHWNKNTNLAWAFDTWFMNLFPRGSVFLNNSGGYSTLSYIPTLGTMLLGTFAGEWLRSAMPASLKVQRLVWAGVLGLAAGWLLGVSGICPVVKRIWTPAWTLYSGGMCFLILAGFYGVMDLGGFRAWAFPLTVVGMNSIVAYCSEWFLVDFLRSSLHIHLPESVFGLLGAGMAPLVEGAMVLVLVWLMLFWLYRKKIFLRI